MHRFFAAAFLVCMIGFVVHAEPTDKDRLDPDWGAVLPLASAIKLVNAKPPDFSGAWTPSANQIALMEEALAKTLTTELADSQCTKSGPCAHKKMVTYRTNHPLRTAEYYRQYAAVFYKGKPTIFVNGFHKSYFRRDTPGDTWRRHIVVVFDGGNEYFWAAYDVDSNSMTEFYFHGDA